MADDFDEDDNMPPPPAADMLVTLRLVNIYRAICQQVRSGSGSTIVFGAIMLAIWYFGLPDAQKFKLVGLFYLLLGAFELCTGLFNRFFPSPEGILIDGLLQLAFVGFIAFRVITTKIFSGFDLLGVLLLFQGIRHIKNYFAIRQALPIRPTRSDLRWFKELMADVRSADPVADDQALDLPTIPPFRAKLLGDHAFFLTPGSDELLIYFRDDVEIMRLPRRDADEAPRAALRLEGDRTIPPFALDAENWNNYTKWKGTTI